jgi:hypothetical protein
MIEFIAYIDEAGDEGFGKLKAAAGVGGQSRWLALGACIVRAADDGKLPKWRDEIIARFPRAKKRDLHFRDLSHDQRLFVCQEIAKRPIAAAITLSHKVTIPGGKWERVFKQKGYLYNYLIRWLLERVTVECHRYAKGQPCRLKLVFSRRGGTDYHSMRTYLENVRDGREMVTPVKKGRWEIIDYENIVVEDHARWAGLQFADCITSAFFTGLEPNPYGNYEPRYAQALKARLFNRGGYCLNWGLTPVPSLHACKCDGEQSAFFEFFRPEK